MQPNVKTTAYDLADTALEDLRKEALELMTKLTDEQLMMALAITFGR